MWHGGRTGGLFDVDVQHDLGSIDLFQHIAAIRTLCRIGPLEPGHLELQADVASRADDSLDISLFVEHETEPRGLDRDPRELQRCFADDRSEEHTSELQSPYVI